MPPRRNPLYWIIISLLLAALATAVACGGGGDDDDDGGGDGETTAPTGDETRPPDDEDGDEGDGDDGGDGETVTFDVNQTFWHSGWEVTLGEGSVAPELDTFGNIESFVLTIEGSFTNLGDDASFFSPDVAVVGASQSYVTRFDYDPPTVGGGLTGSADLLFEVDEDFDFASAYLVVGSGDEVRATVPLGPGGGELVALEPEEAVVTGSISLELIDLTFGEAELRYDIPVTFSAVDEEERALTLHFSAVSRKGGNWNIFANEFTLTKPDGTSIGPDGSGLGSLPGNADGLTTEDLYLRFTVDDPPAGSYTLTFKPGSYWIENGPDQGEFTFELE